MPKELQLQLEVHMEHLIKLTASLHQRMIEAHREAGIDPYGNQPAVRGAVGSENSEEAPILRF